MLEHFGQINHIMKSFKRPEIIKFRVWDISRRKMTYPEDLNHYFLITQKGLVLCNDGVVVDDFHDNFVIQQFIGALDKNKKEMYVGDLTSYSYRGEDAVGEIIYDDMYCGFSFQSQRFFGTGIIQLFGPPVHTVIGNIFENPELLK